MRFALASGFLAMLVGSASAVPREAPLVVASGVSRSRADMTTAMPATAHRRARSMVTTLAARGWQASWDRDTGVARQLWGSFVDAPGAMRDGTIAERAARGFLHDHLAVLAPGAAAADFELVANRVDDNLRTIAFRQTWRGMRVVGGQVSFVFSQDRLFVVGSEALPNVDAPSRAPIMASARQARAEAWLASETRHTVRSRGVIERVVLPIVHAGSVDYHVADVFELESIGAPGRWDVFVGLDGVPLARASKLRFADGTLVFNAGIRSPDGARADYPAPNVATTVDTIATTTGATGGFTWPGTAAATVVPSAVGTFVNVITQSGQPATATLTAQPASPVVWDRATVELEDAQLTSYVFVTLAKAAARVIDRSVGGWLDQQLTVVVNEPGSCNAYSTGDDIHFFVKSAECENTGRMADIIIHEFGHSFHAHAIIPGAGAFDAELSEGLADFLAAHVVDDHALGRGFFLTQEPLRDIDPVGYEFRFPDDLSFDPHVSGMIIAGALWDLRRAAIATLGRPAGLALTEKIFRGILQRSSSIESTYLAAQTIDDDNGNLGDGTPNGCLIGRAFALHGLAPAFVTTTIGTPTTSGLAISLPVTTPTAATCPAPQVTSATIQWESASGDGIVTMTPQAGAYVGAIPSQPDNTLVHHTVTVALDDGSTHRLPRNLGDPKYQLWTGSLVPIWCEPMDANPIPAWTVTNTAGNLWEWGVPDATSYDPNAAHTGTSVLGNLLHQSGTYPSSDMTRIETPVIDVSHYTQVRLQYRRWLTIEDAFYDQGTIEANHTTVWTNASDQGGTLNHLDREWRFHDVDVGAQAASGSLTIGWTLTSDSSGGFGGWTIDDVCVVGLLTPGCGNRVVEADELCDDGNTTDGDGCSASCADEIVDNGTDGGCCGVTRDPMGPMLLGLGVFAVVRRRRSR